MIFSNATEVWYPVLLSCFQELILSLISFSILFRKLQKWHDIYMSCKWLLRVVLMITPTPPVLLLGIPQIFTCTELLHFYYIWTGSGLLKSETKFSKSVIHTENYYSTVYSFMFCKEYLLNGLNIFRVLSQVFLSGLSLA